MKKILIILIIFIFSSVICNSVDKIYINNEIGFSIKYPNNILIRDDYYGEDNKYFLVINSIPMDDSSFKSFARMTKEEYLDKIKNQNINFKKSLYYNGSEKYYKYNGEIIGYSVFTIGGQIITKSITKRLYIIKDNHVITFSLYYNDRELDVFKRFPEYFEITEKKLIYWNDPLPQNSINFYKLISNKSSKIPKKLIKLEKYFDDIINSLQLFDSKSNYYTPTVNNLRFRNNPTLDGKFIRMLNKGEKLELIEKGNPETINGTKGTWVKVKTEKGEVGWCFDAYLKEVKKK